MSNHRWPIASCLVAVLLAGGAAAAAGDFAAFGGLGVPLGDFGDAYKTGFHLGASWEYAVTPLAGVGVRGAWNRFALDEEGFDGHANLLEFLATGRLSAASGLFALVGLGMTNSGGKVGDDDIDSATDFTAAVGGGLQYLMWDFQVLYHTVSAEGDALDYLTFSAGYRF